MLQNIREITKEHVFLSPRKIKAMATFDEKDFKNPRKLEIDLARLGINVQKLALSVSELVKKQVAMDAVLQASITTASITTPIQFLQEWLPGFIHVITAARNIDEFIGLSIVGSIEDEQVIYSTFEALGYAVPYGDYTNVPLSSYNTNFDYATIVRFEQGFKSAWLENLRAARIQISDSNSKRDSCGTQLEISRNYVGFKGFNSGANKTYGFLNAPNLSAYVAVAVGASSSTSWTLKTMLEIENDILVAINALQAQSKSVIDPRKVPLTLAVADNRVNFLNVSTNLSGAETVQSWINKNYPLMRVVSAPELSLANGGQNVFYLYADSVNDTSTDDKKTFIQPVPSKYYALGIFQESKATTEDYVGATGGTICKRPFAVVRYTGI